jgi:uncharacterized membrane protein YbaN (DUF454 family)
VCELSKNACLHSLTLFHLTTLPNTTLILLSCITLHYATPPHHTIQHRLQIRDPPSRSLRERQADGDPGDTYQGAARKLQARVSVVECIVVLCSVVLCSVVLCIVVLCSVVLCSVVLCSVVLCSVV